MRSPSEYVKSYKDHIQQKPIRTDILELVIRMAMEEAIRECAANVPVCHVVEGQCGWDKKEILNLIKEIK